MAARGSSAYVVDEFDKAGIARVECETIAASRVANAPASLECKVIQIVQLPGAANFVTFVHGHSGTVGQLVTLTLTTKFINNG